MVPLLTEIAHWSAHLPTCQNCHAPGIGRSRGVAGWPSLSPPAATQWQRTQHDIVLEGQTRISAHTMWLSAHVHPTAEVPNIPASTLLSTHRLQPRQQRVGQGQRLVMPRSVQHLDSHLRLRGRCECRQVGRQASDRVAHCMQMAAASVQALAAGPFWRFRAGNAHTRCLTRTAAHLVPVRQDHGAVAAVAHTAVQIQVGEGQQPRLDVHYATAAAPRGG